MNKEAKLVLFAIVSVAVLVGVVWLRRRSLENQEVNGQNPLARTVQPPAETADDDAQSELVFLSQEAHTDLLDDPVQPLVFEDPDPVRRDAVLDGEEEPRDLSEPQRVPPIHEPPVLPEQVVHVVQPNENLWSISRKYFGDATHRNAIFEANRDILDDPAHLEVGQRLVIPGVFTTAAPAPIETVAQPPDAPAERTHTVQRGETLSSISRTYFGDDDHHKAIFQANRDRLRDADTVPVGTVLRIPQDAD